MIEKWAKTTGVNEWTTEKVDVAEELIALYKSYYGRDDIDKHVIISSQEIYDGNAEYIQSIPESDYIAFVKKLEENMLNNYYRVDISEKYVYSLYKNRDKQIVEKINWQALEEYLKYKYNIGTSLIKKDDCMTCMKILDEELSAPKNEMSEINEKIILKYVSDAFDECECNAEDVFDSDIIKEISHPKLKEFIYEKIKNRIAELEEKDSNSEEELKTIQKTIQILYDLLNINTSFTFFIPSIIGTWEKLKGISGRIINLIRVCGSALSVIVLAIVGVKYMLESAEGKAKYKEKFTLYIVGCVMVFSISNIAPILYKFAQNLF